MYSTIETIVVNHKSYQIYREILEQYHYFATILKGKFVEKTIKINVDENIDFTKIVDTMHKYYYCQEINIDYFNKLTFSEFINVFSFLEYLQPISENHITTSGMLYVIIRSYTTYIDVNNITINDITSARIGNQYKKLLLQYYIKKTNKVTINFIAYVKDPLSYGQFDNHRPIAFGENLMEYDNINKFFQQYNLTLDKSSLVITCDINVLFDVNYQCFVYINDKKFDVQIVARGRNGNVYLMDTLCTVLIDDFLLK